jgi:hypothetical protein
MTTITQVRRVFALYPKYSGVAANESLVMEACRNRENPHIGRAIAHLAAAGKLGISQNYSSAYEMFFQRHPEYSLDANVAVLDNALVHYCEPVTADNLEELLLPGNPHNVLSQLAITAVAEQAQTEARETERMIAEITAYMLDANRKVKREFTQRQYDDKIAGLRALPFSELAARYDTLMTARAQRKAPLEELRAVVKTDAARQRQALYQRYELIPDLYFPPGKSEGLKWSFDLFKRLPTFEQRRLLDHFGDVQITAACAAKRN